MRQSFPDIMQALKLHSHISLQMNYAAWIRLFTALV